MKVKCITPINENNLILEKFNEFNRKEDYLIYLFSYLTVDKNKKVSVIGTHTEIKELQKFIIEYRKDIKTFGTVNFSMIKDYTLKRICNKIKYLRYSNGIDTVIVSNINILTDYKEEKENIYSTLKEFSNVLNMTIIYLEQEELKNDFNILRNKIENDKSKLICVCGKSTGITKMSISISKYISWKLNSPVVFFSFEVNSEIIKSKNDNLIVIDTPLLIDDICNKIEELKKERNIKFVVIDYIQLIKHDNFEKLDRPDELRGACWKLDWLVRDLDITIIVTSKLTESFKNMILNNRLKEIDDIIYLNEKI